MASVPEDVHVIVEMIDVGGNGDAYVVFNNPVKFDSVSAHFRYGDKVIEWEIMKIRKEVELLKITIPFDIILELKHRIICPKLNKPPTSKLTVVLKSSPKFFKWNCHKKEWVIHEDFTKGDDGPAFSETHVVETLLGGLAEAYRRLKAAEPRLTETFPVASTSRLA